MQQKPNNSLNERMRWAIKSLHASGPSAWALSLSRSLVLSKTKHTHTNIHTQNLSPTDTEIFINSLINLNTNTLIGPVKEDRGGGWGKKKNERQKKKNKEKCRDEMKYIHMQQLCGFHMETECEESLSLLVHLCLDIFLLFISKTIHTGCCGARGVKWDTKWEIVPAQKIKQIWDQIIGSIQEITPFYVIHPNKRYRWQKLPNLPEFISNIVNIMMIYIWSLFPPDV